MEVWKTNSYVGEGFDIQKNDVIVDIGANIGAFSVLAAKNASNVKGLLQVRWKNLEEVWEVTQTFFNI